MKRDLPHRRTALVSAAVSGAADAGLAAGLGRSGVKARRPGGESPGTGPLTCARGGTERMMAPLADQRRCSRPKLSAATGVRLRPSRAGPTAHGGAAGSGVQVREPPP